MGYKLVDPCSCGGIIAIIFYSYFSDDMNKTVTELDHGVCIECGKKHILSPETKQKAIETKIIVYEDKL